MNLYIYDTDFGQGLVKAENEAAARIEAIRDAGLGAFRGNVRKASKEDLAWRSAMGGTTE